MRHFAPLLLTFALCGCGHLEQPAAISDAGAAIAAGRAACAAGMSDDPRPPDLSRLQWQASLQGNRWVVYTQPPQYTVAIQAGNGKASKCGRIVNLYRAP